MGPYIVTVKAAGWREVERDGTEQDAVLSRRAVATLDEALQRVDEVGLILDGTPLFDTAEDIAAIGESGGTVGPLPDGTLIEVEPVSVWDLRTPALSAERASSLAEIIAAFNAAQQASRGDGPQAPSSPSGEAINQTEKEAGGAR